jgi:hypothetical protein
MPPGYGVAEAVIATPQALLLGAALASSFSEGSSFRSSRTTLTILTAWTGALAAHGIYTAVQPRQNPRPGREDERKLERRGLRAPNDPDKPPPHAAARPQWQLAPTFFAERSDAMIPGAVLLGRF